MPLRTLLLAAGVSSAVREVVCEGADRGPVAARERVGVSMADGPVTFTRSLPLAKALHPDTLLAYAMNGEPLLAAHGFPVRLIVPGWYGMTSVKWVTHLRASTQPFTGFFQRDRYILESPQSSERGAIPLTAIAIRSLIAESSDGAVLPCGDHCVRGFAWSGSGTIVGVEVSVDGGATWEPAQLMGNPERYAWRPWQYTWRATSLGPATLASRAFDEAGNGQPDAPVWNRLGYANNAIQTVQVVVA